MVYSSLFAAVKPRLIKLHHSRWREGWKKPVYHRNSLSCLHPARKKELEGKSQLLQVQFRSIRVLTTKMSNLEVFRDFITQRLTTAALEIFRAAEKSFAEFEEEISRSKEESERLQRLLDIVIQPEIKIHRAGSIQSIIICCFYIHYVVFDFAQSDPDVLCKNVDR